jgi:DNA-binding PadR family transcriptional regulator
MMLNMRPMSGYQLRITIARTIGNFWQESFGQIYPALRAMVKDGLVTVTETSEPDQRESKIYALTDAGRARLQAWLEHPCERQVMRDELLLKLFSGIAASPGVLRSHVEEFQKKIQQDLERYRGLEKLLPVAQRDNPSLPYYLLTLRQGLLKADALLRWSEEALQELDRLDKLRNEQPGRQA